jgi:hypothetical protein
LATHEHADKELKDALSSLRGSTRTDAATAQVVRATAVTILSDRIVSRASEDEAESASAAVHLTP